jgi:hypothetical protein
MMEVFPQEKNVIKTKNRCRPGRFLQRLERLDNHISALYSYRCNMRAQTSKTWIWCLVLEAVAGKDQVYRRVGVAKIGKTELFDDKKTYTINII